LLLPGIKVAICDRISSTLLLVVVMAVVVVSDKWVANPQSRFTFGISLIGRPFWE
jgi:hypothetical protein